MILTIKYFGMLTEVTACQEEKLELSEMELASLMKVLYKKYPTLKGKNFRVAQKNAFVANDAKLTNHEIALLPPFSGG